MGKNIIVVGGGISGLSAAYSLMKSGAEVTVLEKNERGGGTLRTGMSAGYLFEYGPNSTMNSNDEIDSLCIELGLDGERIFGSETSRKRYVLRGGKLICIPTGISDFLTTKLWSTKGKLRLLKEPFVGRNRGGEESVASFVSRRIGREMLDYALDPFVSGVYAGDPEKLELKSTFPKMDALEREYGSLIMGALLKGLKGGYRSSRKKGIFSFRKGMETLPDALVKSLGSRFRGGAEVERLEKKGGRFTVRLSGAEEMEADEIILSSPAHVNTGILRHLSPDASMHLGEIAYAPIAVVYLGFKVENVAHPLDGFGCLIPRSERRELLGSLWSSSLFPGRSPEGMAALTNFIGGARNMDAFERSDDELVDAVIDDLRDIIGVKGEPSFIKIVRQRQAIPQYNLGHGKRLVRIEEALRSFPGIYLLGNYLKGISVADCVMNGVKMASKMSKG